MTNDTRLYLGVWFQRTSLHLKEFKDFLSGKDNGNNLDTQKLSELRKSLNLKNISFIHKNDVNLLRAENDGIDISVSEDGVILIHSNLKNSLEKEAKKLESFYSKKLSPALSYLYSRGAPLPKDLSAIKEVYPLYLMGSGLEQKEIKDIFNFINDEAFLIEEKDGIKIYTGNEIMVVDIDEDHPTMENEDAQSLIRNIVLFREFEKQLSQYLNLHRDIWEGISKIRESESLTLENFPKIRSEILGYLKTLSFVRARLCQMKDILDSREKTLSDKDIKVLDDLDLENRFKILSSEQAYILNLWDMTTDYAKGTLDLLDSLLTENTQKEIGLLQVITFIGVATGFFGMNIAFPWNPEWSVLFRTSYIVLGIILLFAISTRFFLNFNINKKRVRLK